MKVRQNELKEIAENITTSKVKQYPLKKNKMEQKCCTVML
jgi:hypothetical protein